MVAPKVLRQMIIDDEGEPEGESLFDREQCMNERFSRLRKFTTIKLKSYLDSEIGDRTTFYFATRTRHTSERSDFPSEVKRRSPRRTAAFTFGRTTRSRVG